ncbi:hypothetical protein [Actinomyces respiraculi]|uniref:hypothetical protein n=1 Tax=Actinomyces respiraculi TaxID=2744574 RepID=UPI0014234DD6|nr:hypothetical protein [Actinomyces respiraculi]
MNERPAAPGSDDENPATPGSDDVEVPTWILDLVPVADLARNHLRASLWTAVVVVLAIVGGACLSTGTSGLTTTLLPVFGVTGLLLAGVVTGRLRRSGPTPTSPGESTAPLRPGGRTLAALLVLDIVGTALGLVVLAAAALCGIDGALVGAALLVGVLIAVGTAGVLVDELFPGWRLRWFGGTGTAALLVLLASGGVLALGRGLWWLVLGLAVVADLAGLLALRAGRRRDLADPARSSGPGTRLSHPARAPQGPAVTPWGPVVHRLGDRPRLPGARCLPS